jgi:hypothetical protein
MPKFTVASTSQKGNEKRVKVVGDRGSATFINLPKFALVGPSDSIEMSSSAPGRVYVVSQEDGAGLIPVKPVFAKDLSVKRGDRTFEFRACEFHSERDAEAYNFLEQFHYRTSAREDEIVGTQDQSSQGARRAVIVLYHIHGGTQSPAGYIELQMPKAVQR